MTAKIFTEPLLLFLFLMIAGAIVSWIASSLHGALLRRLALVVVCLSLFLLAALLESGAIAPRVSAAPLLQKAER